MQQLKLLIKERGEEILTQVELRNLANEKAKGTKKCYMAEAAGINRSILSRFLNGHIDLYPHLFEKLESYLTSNN